MTLHEAALIDYFNLFIYWLIYRGIIHKKINMIKRCLKNLNELQSIKNIDPLLIASEGITNPILTPCEGITGKYKPDDVSTSPTAGTACAKSEGLYFPVMPDPGS